MAEVTVDCDCGRRRAWTVRVTGGRLDGAHESTYACDECAPVVAADLRQRWAEVEIVPLRNQRAVEPAPRLFDD